MAEPKADLQQIGMSADTRRVLNELKSAGHISELIDGYRLAVAVACAFGCQPRLGGGGVRTTAFNTATVDTPDLAMRTAIGEMFPDVRAIPYRAIEDLAEQGVEILDRQMDGDDLNFTALVDKVEGANAGVSPAS